jgi:erythromycin esterase-like protein
MFATLKNLLAFHGSDSKAVVWAHNSHVGNAGATDMAARGGEHNIGQLCRKEFGNQAYMVGFGTHGGTVAAASEWGGPMEVKMVRPALPDSYEHLCHATGLPCLLPPKKDAGPCFGRLNSRTVANAPAHLHPSFISGTSMSPSGTNPTNRAGLTMSVVRVPEGAFPS